MDLADIRIATRTLLRRRSYSLPAILTLALGIGATTAVFSVVYQVLIRPLPYQNPEELLRIYATRNSGRWTSTPPNYVDIRKQNRSLQSMAAFYGSSFALTGDARDAEQIRAAMVTADFFKTLGIRPMLGRDFHPDDEVPGQDKVVLLSHGLWTRRFAAAADVVGQTIRMDGVEWLIAGVLPPKARYPDKVEMWAPLAFSSDDLLTQRGAHYLDIIARLQPGVSLAQASAELRLIGERLATEYPDKNRGWGIEVITLHESMVGKVRRPLVILFGAVVLLLLISCVNVTNLTLAQGLSRRRELAIRAAIGARRGRLTRELLVESLLLALVGGVAAMLISAVALQVMISSFPDRIPRLEEASLNIPVLLFAIGVSLLTGIVVGILPALEIGLSADLSDRLKEGAQNVGVDRRGSRLRSALVISEVALAVLLLTASGLVLKSFARLINIDPGFGLDRRLTFNLSLPATRYATPEQRRDFTARLLDQLGAIPEVDSAAAVFGLPLSGLSYSISLKQLDGVPVEPRDDLSVQVRVASADYFRTLDIPQLHGRSFLQSDDLSTPRVIVVNESAARKLWGERDPIGRSLELGTKMGTGQRIGGTVVGLVNDIRHDGATQPSQPEVYFPYSQVPVDYLSVVLKTEREPENVIPAARAKLRQLDPELPMFEPQTLQDLSARSVASARFYTTLINAFGALALTLAAIGIYGVIAFSVGRRTREIGIRMALGARPADVLRKILGQGMGLTLAGVGAGLLGAIGILRLLAGLLFQTKPNDLPTYLGVAVALLLTAIIASYIPARRAMRVDPMEALRYE